MSVIAIDLRMLRHSGIGTYLENLVPRVIARLPAHRFVLLGRTGDIGQVFAAIPSNVEIQEFCAPIYSAAEQIEIAARASRGVDLFWAPHYNFPILFPGRLLVTVHDLFHLAMPQFAGGAHKRAYARAMFRILAHRAAGIVCVSRFTENELGRLVGPEPSRIVVVPNGLAVEPAGPADAARPHPAPYLLFVGNVKPNKNLRGLLDAFGRVRDTIPHDLVVAGRTEGFRTGDRHALRAAAGLGNRVVFTGEVDRATLRQYYFHAEALVFPSLYEGFGFPPLEAMALGCPVIASRAASIPEVCGDAAHYFAPNDPGEMAIKILDVVSDNQLREELKGKGTARAGLFSWDRCADDTAQAIRNVLDRGRPQDARSSFACL